MLDELKKKLENIAPWSIVIWWSEDDAAEDMGS